jgi:hypothetical protein
MYILLSQVKLNKMSMVTRPSEQNKLSKKYMEKKSGLKNFEHFFFSRGGIGQLIVSLNQTKHFQWNIRSGSGPPFCHLW